VNSYLHSSVALVIVGFIALVMPVWELFEARRLRAKCNSRDRLRYYAVIMACLWLLTSGSLQSLGSERIWTAAGCLGLAQSSFQNPILRYSLLGISVLFSLLVLSPFLITLAKPKLRIAYTKALDKVPFAFFFPHTATERGAFAALSISAGVCEEIIFRSFLVAYFASYGANVLIALLISSVLFGINHGYQGWIGVLKTGVAGFLFGMLFFTTGSLVAAIVLHGITDLSALFYYRPDLSAPPSLDGAPASALH
jgi:membrane protease YdiL (CAAX protease family)